MGIMHLTLKQLRALLWATVVTLVGCGLVVLYSASMAKGSTSSHYVSAQAIWLFVSLICMAAIYFFGNLRLIQRLAPLIGVLCVFALIAVLIPGVGYEAKGSRRWIVIVEKPNISFQPSEFAKIGVIFFMAWWIARYRRYMHKFLWGAMFPMMWVGIIALLLLREPDFGSTALMASVMGIMLYLGGSKLRNLSLFVVGGGGLFVFLVAQNENRMMRITSFLNPEEHVQEGSWQLINSITAFASGGLHGVGLGKSVQKYYYLPEVHTDFIFPVLGEELGLFASLFFFALYWVLFYCGIQISARARGDFSRFVALGCTLMISFQALINIAVVTGSVPTKGLSLPFFSYGGSSLLVCLCMIALLDKILCAKSDALFKDQHCAMD